jgi:dTDP-4-amino-4,6-dideoxygalactose transaminase
VKGDRARIFNELREKGISANVHYIPVYWQPFYQNLGYSKGLCPKAERYYSQTITLPLYPKMSDEDVKYVVKNVLEIFEGSA